MQDQVRALKCLSDGEKEKLSAAWAESHDRAEACLPSLSLFSQKTTRGAFGKFSFERVLGEVYYLGKYSGDLGIFVDSEKRLIFSSKYYFSHLESFFQNIDAIQDQINNIDFSKTIDIGNNYVSIEKWFITYGHFKDEAYSLGHFLRSYPDVENFSAIVDYPIDERLDTPSFQHNLNYMKIDRFIFGEQSLNAYCFKGRPLKLRNLYLVNNHIKSETFHSFPPAISERIKGQVSSRGLVVPSNIAASGKVFLTRSQSYRDIANKVEIELAARSKGFTIVNPEDITYEEMVNILASAKTVIMYYGSAMTNLVYMPPSTKVFILKSASYLHESLDLWAKIISAYALNIKEVPAIENVIPLSELTRISDLCA